MPTLASAGAVCTNPLLGETPYLQDMTMIHKPYCEIVLEEQRVAVHRLCDPPPFLDEC